MVIRHNNIIIKFKNFIKNHSIMSHRKALGITRNRFEQLGMAKQQLHKKKYRYYFLKILRFKYVNQNEEESITHSILFILI